MRLLLIALFTAILTWVLQMFLPWWSVAIAAFMTSLVIAQKGVQALFGSFLGAFGLWVIMATIIDVRNDSILSDRVADIFFVKRPVFLIIVTGVIGGLAAMLAGLSGYFLRRLTVGRPAPRSSSS